VSDQPYPPLRPQPPVRRRTRPPQWPLIAGVVVLAVLAAILALVLLTRGEPGTGSTSPTASPSGSAAASGSAGGAASPTASAGSSAAPGSPAPTLARDTIVATAVDGLSVRGEPGLGGERLGTLALGAPSFVLDGPTDADGFSWYLVSGLRLPPNTGCAGELDTDPFNCPIWFGWVAAASESGEAWLVPDEPDCPDAPLTAANLGVGRSGTQLLACFGSEPITFRGWWPEIPDDAGLGGACAAQEEPSGWLLCQNINYDIVLADEGEDFFGIGVRVSTDPASGVAMPERGTWVEVTGHYDDPAAQGCDEAANAAGDAEDPDALIVLICRTELVLESVEAVEGP
jgi:hypothetical protein